MAALVLTKLCICMVTNIWHLWWAYLPFVAAMTPDEEVAQLTKLSDPEDEAEKSPRNCTEPEPDFQFFDATALTTELRISEHDDSAEPAPESAQPALRPVVARSLSDLEKELTRTFVPRSVLMKANAASQKAQQKKVPEYVEHAARTNAHTAKTNGE